MMKELSIILGFGVLFCVGVTLLILGVSFVLSLIYGFQFAIIEFGYIALKSGAVAGGAVIVVLFIGGPRPRHGE